MYEICMFYNADTILTIFFNKKAIVHTNIYNSFFCTYPFTKNLPLKYTSVLNRKFLKKPSSKYVITYENVIPLLPYYLPMN